MIPPKKYQKAFTCAESSVSIFFKGLVEFVSTARGRNDTKVNSANNGPVYPGTSIHPSPRSIILHEVIYIQGVACAIAVSHSVFFE